MKTNGINHLALVCRDMAQTLHFYTQVLDMPLVKTVALPGGGQHFFFDCGGGSLLAFFWWPDVTEGAPGVASVEHFPSKPKTAVGSMNHVAFNVDEPVLEEYLKRLEAAGVPTFPMVLNHDDSEHGVAAKVHPGVFVRSVYFTDPNGVMLEFAALTRPLGTAEDIRHAPRQPGACVEKRLMAPRLRQVPRAEVKSKTILDTYRLLFGDRDPVAEPGTDTGTPGDWWTTFANSEDVFEHAVRGFALYRNPKRRLDPVLRELGQTRAGWNKASQFVFSQHCKSLRGLGVAETKIAAVPSWGVSDVYDARERAVLSYTDCLTLDGGRTPEPIFAALRSFLDDEEILELTYITMLYDMHAVMSRALRTEYDDRDEPIVEVAAPEGFSARDFLDTGRR